VLAAAAEELCGGRLVSVLEGGYAVEKAPAGIRCVLTPMILVPK
jgi:acetoin utilization deacetylase AcuC-like enzyme